MKISLVIRNGVPLMCMHLKFVGGRVADFFYIFIYQVSVRQQNYLLSKSYFMCMAKELLHKHEFYQCQYMILECLIIKKSYRYILESVMFYATMDIIFLAVL